MWWFNRNNFSPHSANSTLFVHALLPSSKAAKRTDSNFQRWAYWTNKYQKPLSVRRERNHTIYCETSLHWIKTEAHKGGWNEGDHTKCIWDTSKIKKNCQIWNKVWIVPLLPQQLYKALLHFCHFQTYFKIQQVIHSLSKKLVYELYTNRNKVMFITSKPFLLPMFINMIFYTGTS